MTLKETLCFILNYRTKRVIQNICFEIPLKFRGFPIARNFNKFDAK